MWCFFDESWPDDNKGDLVVVAGILVNDEFLPALDRLVFKLKRKYLGEENAKNPESELKGTHLLSNFTFKLAQQPPDKVPYVKNHALVKDLLGELIKERDDNESNNYIRVFASAVSGNRPELLCPDMKRIPVPYKWLCQNISRAVEQYDNSRRAVLIYDQRFRVQTSLAITIKNFNLGLRIGNLHPVPYFGVSHATPCLQISDVIVYIIAKHLAGDRRFQPFYDLVKRLQWTDEVDGRLFYGINSWKESTAGYYTKR